MNDDETKKAISKIFNLPPEYLFGSGMPFDANDEKIWNERVVEPILLAQRRFGRAVSRLHRRFERQLDIEMGLVDLGGEG